MLVSYTVRRQGIEDRNRWVECDITFDSSYPTGGEQVNLAAIGLRTAIRADVVHSVSPDGNPTGFTNHGRQVVPVLTDPTVPRLRVFTANNTEAGNGSDQSQIVTRIRFVGN